MSAFLLTSLLDKNDLTIAVESIKSGIEFTQSAAITHQRSAIFCSTNNHLVCDNDWNNGPLTVLIGKEILYQYSPLPSTYQLLWKSSLGKNNRLTFTKEGTAEQQGSFYFCKKKSNDCPVRIILLQTGRTRIEQVDLTQ
jgi:Tfp pilus assembly protein FimT